MYIPLRSVLAESLENLSVSLIGKLTGSVFSNCLAVFFYGLFRALYDVRVEGLKNYTASPATLITINHKRDLDVPIVASTLHLSKNPLKRRRRMHFVAREDLFQRGFLTAHFPVFGITGPLVHRINIRPVMKALQAHPISHLVRQRIGPMIRELERTDARLVISDVIGPSGLDRIDAMLNGKKSDNLGDLPLGEFLGYSFSRVHQQTCDTGILRNEYAGCLRNRTLKKVGEQLRAVAGILDEGRICMLAPEGQTSPDGRFWPVKSGLFRLISMTKNDVRVLPVNTTYDYMTKRCMRIYVTIGPELTTLKGMGKVELEKLVQRNIVTLGLVTFGHLGSEFLLDMLNNGCDKFEEKECIEKAAERVQELRGLDMRLEESLHNDESLRKRAGDFMVYCRRNNILKRDDHGRFFINTGRIDKRPFDKFHENPVRYSANEFGSLLEWYRQNSR